MRLGATLVHLSDGPQRPIAAWARRLADAGFEGLWTPEIVGRGTLVPDPFVTLAVAAAATVDVELGTATVQVPLHHPAELAHRMLSLMSVCGDRLTFGVSPGSTRTDYDVYDRQYAERFPAFRRDVARVRGLLAHGRDDGADLAPFITPDGAPALLLGSWGANVERAAHEFDGWIASGYRSSVEDIVAALDRFRQAGGGRAMVCAIPVDGPGDLAPAQDALGRYAEAGFDDAIVLIGPRGPDPEEVRALLPVVR